jgi:hypothetical protein
MEEKPNAEECIRSFYTKKKEKEFVLETKLWRVVKKEIDTFIGDEKQQDKIRQDIMNGLDIFQLDAIEIKDEYPNPDTIRHVMIVGGFFKNWSCKYAIMDKALHIKVFYENNQTENISLF